MLAPIKAKSARILEPSFTSRNTSYRHIQRYSAGCSTDKHVQGSICRASDEHLLRRCLNKLCGIHAAEYLIPIKKNGGGPRWADGERFPRRERNKVEGRKLPLSWVSESTTTCPEPCLCACADRSVVVHWAGRTNG